MGIEMEGKISVKLGALRGSVPRCRGIHQEQQPPQKRSYKINCSTMVIASTRVRTIRMANASQLPFLSITIPRWQEFYVLHIKPSTHHCAGMRRQGFRTIAVGSKYDSCHWQVAVRVVVHLAPLSYRLVMIGECFIFPEYERILNGPPDTKVLLIPWP